MLTQLLIATSLVVVIVVVLAGYLTFQREQREEAALAEARAAGRNQPVSLHPVIDLETCIGSGACIDVCPEQVLGRVTGVTQLVQAAGCIGHGRCNDACPVGAIALVFGTAERGVDIPLLRKNYESNVDGIYIVGELGGMGLIRNAMRQGVKAVELGVGDALGNKEVVHSQDPDVVDVIIVGGGPAGIAAALECTQRGLTYSCLEQFSLGGSVAHYPRRKLVFTEQIQLPIVGKFGKAEMLKEELIDEFERICLAAGITLLEGRRVTGVKGQIGDFHVSCEVDGTTEVHRGRTVVLAIGRRGTPRKLDVPGEELSHVVYRLLDAEQYRHRRVLCVGGGDSSVEAAISLSMVAGTEVHLSYRGESFYRVKKKNREELEAAVGRGRITLHLETTVTSITSGTATLNHKTAGPRVLEVEDLIINVGGVLPTPFLESMGIEVETKFGDVATTDKKTSRRSRKTRLSGSQRKSRYSTRLKTGTRQRSAGLPPSTRMRRRSGRRRKKRDPETGELQSDFTSDFTSDFVSGHSDPTSDDSGRSDPRPPGEDENKLTDLGPLQTGDSEPFSARDSEEETS